MKKKSIIAAALAFALAGCGTMGTTSNGQGGLGDILGAVLGAATSGGTITNVLLDVIGLNKMSEADILGTWRYAEPGIAFTSQNALQKAGGQVISGTLK